MIFFFPNGHNRYNHGHNDMIIDYKKLQILLHFNEYNKGNQLDLTKNMHNWHSYQQSSIMYYCRNLIFSSGHNRYDYDYNDYDYGLLKIANFFISNKYNKSN